MPIAAVPKYLQERDAEFYLSAPPGHRFLLYFAAWGENQETGQIDWRMEDRVPKIDKKTKKQKMGKSGLDWENLPNDQFACTIAACKTPQYDEEKPRARKPKADPGLKPWERVMNALLTRQTAAAMEMGSNALLRLDAKATAPFTTGLGNEHPLENGFAFLNPYGLPYLPGSGVKGVLRQAARELASGDWGEPRGWGDAPCYPLFVDGKPVLESKKQPVVLSMLDVLFGRETPASQSDHVRGTLSFWDVVPQIAGDSLMVEIMTPHQGHYYQWKKDTRGREIEVSPHDSGQPNPICFLTVPPGSLFTLHVICDLAHLARLTSERTPGAPDLLADGHSHWKKLLDAAFQHAFDWLGFGAKTAVGYGAMEDRAKARTETHTSAPAEERPKHAPASGRSQNDFAKTVWERARLKFNAKNGTLIAVGPNNAEANALAPRGPELLASLPAEVQRKVRANEFVRVVARVRGSELIAVEIPRPV